jgi:hypothetical protein
MAMRRFLVFACLLGISVLLHAQEKRLWVLRASGEMVELDPVTFAVKATVKMPADAAKSPQNVAVTHLGQILSVPGVSLPLADSDLESSHKAWLWNGHAAATIDMGVKHETGESGSNTVVTESAPEIHLSADGAHLFWFANESRRLVRDEVDLSETTTWRASQTDLSGGAREELASSSFPDCRCPTGACEESCPVGAAWVPDDGAGKFFYMTQFTAGKAGAVYKETSRCQKDDTHWTCSKTPDPLRRLLDASPDGALIVEAIPDTGCCGWSNQSDDQTVVHANGKTETIFDELATYKNADYDVSFFTSNAFFSPALDSIAITISSTALANQPIQLSQQGDANPEESRQIRNALANLPAVEVKSLSDPAKLVAHIPHATLVGWLNEKEILIVENRLLVAYNISNETRRKSTVQIDDPARVFLR